MGKGWLDLKDQKKKFNPQKVLFVEEIPHNWLFPKCFATVNFF